MNNVTTINRTVKINDEGRDNMQARIILVGGFLGAGKTSLLFEAANKLAENGKSVGLITNDQAPELVDTTFLEHTKGVIKEVSGSCFCCNYKGFTDAILHLTESTTEVPHFCKWVMNAA